MTQQHSSGPELAFVGDGVALLVDRPVMGYVIVIANGAAVIGTGLRCWSSDRR